jgi:hypothetical protein
LSTDTISPTYATKLSLVKLAAGTPQRRFELAKSYDRNGTVAATKAYRVGLWIVIDVQDQWGQSTGSSTLQFSSLLPKSKAHATHEADELISGHYSRVPRF